MDQVVDHGFRDPNQFEQIISCLREGVLVLDEYGDLVWVNDAALQLHGAEAESELGETWQDYAQRFELRYRNNHRLPAEAYPMARALAGENLRDIVVEVRKAGEEDPVWTHSVCSLRLAGSSSGPRRIVLLITDLTEQYRAERRFESAFNANPAPAIICRLSDLRYVRVNAGFLEMTGYAREEVVGRSAYELDVLADAEKRELALERLKQGRTVPQMESCIQLHDGAKKFVIVAGEPIQIGAEGCMLFTFTDLDPLKKTELALRHSEERFSKSFHLSPVPQTIALLKGFKITEVNRAFREKTGYTDEEVIGRSARELVLWDDGAAQRQIEDAIARTGSIDGIDMKMRTKDGATIDCLTSAVTVTINNESCVLWVIQDIGDRKRSEDELMTAIEAVMEDTSWFSRTVVEKLAGLRRATSPLPPSAELDELTERERDILDLICQGQSDEAMSKTLGLSRNTIRNHISSLYRKIGVNRRSAAIIWARERGVTGRDTIPRRKSHAGTGSKEARK
ncbi:PAS domain S-box protein [Chelatococcus sp. GCM10030263]|uniref:PAS domain S-box protein n=1 Tax=Chelatococcus sp. GCM10030263 TaxID=3273387 RepID=UPI00361178CF